MKKCPTCGKENGDESKFCIWCGNEIPEIQEKKKKNLVIWVSGFLLILLAVVGVFFLGRNYRENIHIEQKKTAQGDIKDGIQENASTDTGKYLAPFCNEDGKWGYVDIEGNIVIECQYDYAYSFGKYGQAVVIVDTEEGTENYGLINERGEKIFFAECDFIGHMFGTEDSEYTEIVRCKDGESDYSGVVDQYGNVFLSPEFKSLLNIGDSGYFIALPISKPQRTSR